MAQDGRLELTQLRRRVQAQLVPQHIAELAVDIERFGLPAIAVKGQHELTAEPLSHRMFTDQPPQLSYQDACRAEGQVGLDSLFQAGQVQLLEPHDLGLGKRFVAEIG